MFRQRLIKLLKIILDPFFLSALIKGSAAGTEHIKVLGRYDFDLIVDIGANRGQFALVARKLFPHAKILAFEPLKEPTRIFKNIFGGDPNVILYPCALGREKTTLTMHIAGDDHSSSLLPIAETLTAMFPGTIEKGTRQVDVLPLSQALGDTSILPASLLKIDVQGYELEVLKGCEDILDQFSHLYVECCFVELYEGQALAHEVISWLAGKGFDLTGAYNLYYAWDGQAVFGDFLFTHFESE